MTRKDLQGSGPQNDPVKPATRPSGIEPMTGESAATSPFSNETIETVRTSQGGLGYESSVGILGRVQKGMKVIDAAGKEVGKVADIKLADVDAASDWGEEAPPTMPGWMGNVAERLEHPGTDQPGGELHDRLIHEGYLRLDTKGIFRRDRYIEADQIASVRGDEVRLLVDFDHLTEA